MIHNENGKENIIFLNEARPILILAASSLAKTLGTAVCVPTIVDNLAGNMINAIKSYPESNFFILGIGPSDEGQDNYIYQILKKYKDRIKLWLSNHPVGIWLEYLEEYQELVTYYSGETCLPDLVDLGVNMPKSWLKATHLLKMNPRWQENNPDEKILIRYAKIFRVKAIFEENTGNKRVVRNVIGKSIEEILSGEENKELSLLASLYNEIPRKIDELKRYLIFHRKKIIPIGEINPYVIDFHKIAELTKSIAPYQIEYRYFGATYSLTIDGGKIISRQKYAKEIKINNDKTSTG